MPVGSLLWSIDQCPPVPSSWTEDVVTDSIRASVQNIGRTRGIKVPLNWPEGSEVRVLLLPRP